MKIILPKTLGLISRTYNYKEDLFTVGGLGFFRLGEDNAFLPDNQCWKQLEPYLNQGLVLDMGFVKAKGEWLLAGSAHTENGKSVKKMQVSARLGSSKKRIQVIGDREWSGRFFSFASEPKPFTSMPLCYSRAYGGVGYKHNPLGRGVIKKANKNKATGRYALPNLYLPKEKTSVDKKRRSVAGFGPVDMSVPHRTRFHGRFNRHWLKNIHPGFPHDTDPRYFNAAPEDQQFTGPIKPGAEYELVGMHPTQARICGRLPKMNVRAFVMQQASMNKPMNEEFIEIKTHMDTVWFFPELLLGVAIYRGQLAVRDCDALDIKTLMLAYERVSDEPRATDHYKQQLLHRTDKKKAGIHTFNDDPLIPKALMPKKSGTEKTNDKVRSQQALIDDGDRDLSESFQNDERTTANQFEVADDKLAELQEQATFRKILKESEESLRQRVFNPVYLSGVDTSASDGPMMNQSAVAQRQSRQAASSCTVMALPLEDADADLIRSWVVELLQQGVSLAGRDLAGANLSGLDFSQQDLRDVMFEKANLSNSRFTNCQLQGAVFTQAHLDNAIFDGADATQTNWSKVQAANISFKQANLTGAQMEAVSLRQCDFTLAILDKIKLVDSDLSDSCMQQVRCHQGQFMQSMLQRTNWQEANISRGNFVGCHIQQSVWRNAKLQRTLILDAKAEEASFCHVQGQNVQFSNVGDFTKADFSNSHWQSCGFRLVTLQQAMIKSSVFDMCDFGETNLNGVNLSESLFKSCMMDQADLSQSICRKTLFALSSLRKVTFDRTNLRTTRFQNSSLEKAVFVHCKPNKALVYPATAYPRTAA